MSQPVAPMSMADMSAPADAGEATNSSQSDAKALNLDQAKPMPVAALPRLSSLKMTGKCAAPEP
eukprot:7911770-Heterocapsa_arctica.AAC.1